MNFYFKQILDFYALNWHLSHEKVSKRSSKTAIDLHSHHKQPNWRQKQTSSLKIVPKSINNPSITPLKTKKFPSDTNKQERVHKDRSKTKKVSTILNAISFSWNLLATLRPHTPKKLFILITFIVNMWFFFLLSLVDLNGILNWNLFIFTGIYWYDDDDINEKHYHLPSHFPSSLSHTIQKKHMNKKKWKQCGCGDVWVTVSYTKIFFLLFYILYISFRFLHDWLSGVSSATEKKECERIFISRWCW